MAGGWQFVLADLAAGTALGEVTKATARTLTVGLNRLPTAAFTVRLDHPLAGRMLEATALVQAYQVAADGSKTLRFAGPVVAAEESAQGAGGTLQVTAAGAFWRLGHRLIGRSAAGFSQGSAVSQVDRGQIAAAILAAVNADGDTGIRLGTVQPSAPGYVGPWRFIPASEAITQLSATLDGFDFEVAPVEPTVDSAGLQIGTLNVAGVIGQTRPEAIFEYGTGRRNVQTYTRPVTLDGLLNAAWNLPEGFPENPVSAVVSSSDATSIAQWGRMEGLVTGDVTVDAMRAQLVAEHVRIRRNPRQVITFDPARTAPRFGPDYLVGDVVTARARVGGSTRFDGQFRVYGVTVSIDDEGTATEQLELVPST